MSEPRPIIAAVDLGQMLSDLRIRQSDLDSSLCAKKLGRVSYRAKSQSSLTSFITLP